MTVKQSRRDTLSQSIFGVALIHLDRQSKPMRFRPPMIIASTVAAELENAGDLPN